MEGGISKLIVVNWDQFFKTGRKDQFQSSLRAWLIIMKKETSENSYLSVMALSSNTENHRQASKKVW